jgi:hypothetical protein
MISIEYLEEAIASFRVDRPSTDYQKGYLAALQELLRVAEAQLQ